MEAKLSRRNFLKLAGMVFATALLPKLPEPEEEECLVVDWKDNPCVGERVELFRMDFSWEGRDLTYIEEIDSETSEILRIFEIPDTNMIRWHHHHITQLPDLRGFWPMDEDIWMPG